MLLIQNNKIRVFFIFLFMLFSVCGLTGCGKNDGSPEGKKQKGKLSPKDEIVEFINVDLAGIQEDRDQAVENMNSYFSGNGISDTTEDLEELEKETLLRYETYLREVEAIDIRNDEIKEVKALYYEAALMQRDAMQNMLDALKTSDENKITAARENLSEYDKLMGDYKDKLKELCEKYHIEMK